MNLPLDKNTNYVATYTFVLAYGSACPEGIPRRPIPKKKIVLKIILKIILRCNFDFETCPNYQPFRNFLVYKISR